MFSVILPKAEIQHMLMKYTFPLIIKKQKPGIKAQKKSYLIITYNFLFNLGSSVGIAL